MFWRDDLCWGYRLVAVVNLAFAIITVITLAVITLAVITLAVIILAVRYIGFCFFADCGCGRGR